MDKIKLRNIGNSKGIILPAKYLKELQTEHSMLEFNNNIFTLYPTTYNVDDLYNLPFVIDSDSENDLIIYDKKTKKQIIRTPTTKRFIENDNDVISFLIEYNTILEKLNNKFTYILEYIRLSKINIDKLLEKYKKHLETEVKE